MKSGSICFEKAAPETGVKGMVPKENAMPYDFQNLKNSLELLLIDLYEASNSSSAETGRSNYENRDKNIFDEITQFLQKNLYTSLTLGDICRECAVSPFLLKRVCKSQCGMSPISYFTSLKLGAAKQMICDTDMNFTQTTSRPRLMP
jgi:AraC-like DNA-binding protein